MLQQGRLAALIAAAAATLVAGGAAPAGGARGGGARGGGGGDGGAAEADAAGTAGSAGRSGGGGGRHAGGGDAGSGRPVGLLDEVAALDRAIAAATTARAEAEARARVTESEVEALRTEAAKLETKATRAGAAARRRVRALYVAARGGGLAYLAGADSFGELMHREQIATLAARRDLTAVRASLTLRRAAADASARLAARAAALRALDAELERFDEASRAERDRKVDFAVRVAGDPTLRLALDAELTRATLELEGKLRAGKLPGVSAPAPAPASAPLLAAVAPAPAPPAPAPASASRGGVAPPGAMPAPPRGATGLRRGAVPWPVAGAVLERGFGRATDPLGGTAVVNRGWDLRAPAGTPVRTVAAGRVLFAGWYRGYGNLVIVDHGAEHHTLYAHLASIAKATGEVLSPGDALGGLGDTGSLKGPYLYFEVRVRGAAQDPAAWLAAAPVSP
ncbi:MAG TPA: M23 family metallopeptidase [Myxococcota bacterium]|jgi:murein DD-endopeptidase MepM/ murein hydrolase activator NlpD|nr:M23 family metallopeptidase [Myxococcota bacterium]